MEAIKHIISEMNDYSSIISIVVGLWAIYQYVTTRKDKNVIAAGQQKIDEFQSLIKANTDFRVGQENENKRLMDKMKGMEDELDKSRKAERQCSEELHKIRIKVQDLELKMREYPPIKDN